MKKKQMGGPTAGSQEHNIDVGACSRQAIGGVWSDRRDDIHVTRSLLEGTLKLSPHGDWDFQLPIDWKADPFSQNNWRFQLCTLRWLDPARRIALSSSDFARDAREFWCSVVFDWISNGIDNGDKFSWYDMVDGQRAIALTLGYPLCRSEKERNLLQQTIARHQSHLADYGNRGHGNHELHQIAGLLVTSCFLGLEEGVEQARSDALQLFSSAYDDESVNEEAALGYHDLNFVWWRQLLERFTAEGIVIPELEVSLRESRKALLHAVRPDGILETIGDTAPGKKLSNDGMADTEYVRSAGREGVPPDARTVVLNRGYVFGRSGWGEYERSFSEETFYSLRFGRDDAIHGHPDSSSFTIHLDGYPWIVDPGMFAYATSPYRRYFLSRRAHNVVDSPSIDFDKTASTRLVCEKRTDAYDFFHLQIAGYKGFQVTRKFVYNRAKDCFFVHDSVVKTGREVRFPRFDLLLQCSPDVDVELTKGTALLSQGERKVAIRWINRPGLEVAIGRHDPDMRGWYSPEYAKAVPSPQIRAVSSQRGQVEWFYSIARENDQIRPISWTENDSELIVEFSGLHGRETLRIGLDHSASVGSAPATELRASSSEGENSPPAGIDVIHEALRETCSLLRNEAENSEGSSERRRALYHAGVRELEKWGFPRRDSGLRALLSDLSPLVGVDRSALVRNVGDTRFPLAITANADISVREKGYTAVCRPYSPEESKFLKKRTRLVYVERLDSLQYAYSVLPFGQSHTLMVVFRGAVRRESVTLPLLGGATLGQKLGLATMSVSDPTLDLDLDLTLGWYLGEKECDAHKSIANRIGNVAAALRVKRVVLVGSSGGGFAALATSRHLKHLETDVVAFNPQVSILDYYPTKAEQVCLAVFGKHVSEISSDEHSRFDLLRAPQDFDSNVTIHYFQNSSDNFHRKNHFEKFQSVATSLDFNAGFIPHIVDNGVGHAAPSSQDIIAAVSAILD